MAEKTTIGKAESILHQASSVIAILGVGLATLSDVISSGPLPTSNIQWIALALSALLGAAGFGKKKVDKASGPY